MEDLSVRRRAWVWGHLRSFRLGLAKSIFRGVGSLKTAAVVLTLATACASASRAGSLLFTEDFKSAIAPGWNFRGNASLTGGSSDPNGNGWLRLTNNTYNQSSFVFETTDLPFRSGIDVKLSVAIWGGTGADGLTVNLINGSQNISNPGGYGGSLGYAQRTSPGPAAGLPGGILGIGIDEYGNFSNPTEGRVGGPGFRPNSVAVRGPGDGTLNSTTSNGTPNYPYLTGGTVTNGLQTGADGTTTRPANYYTAEFLIGTNQVSQGHLPITVMLTDDTGVHTIIDNYDAYADMVAYYGSAANIPQTMNIGFSSGTGALYDYHELRNLSITSIDDIPGYSPVPEPPASLLVLVAGSLILFGSAWGRRTVQRVTSRARR